MLSSVRAGVRAGVQQVLARRLASTVSAKKEVAFDDDHQEGLVPDDCPVRSYNEWDCLEEVIVGRPDGARVPKLGPEVKVSSSDYLYQWDERAHNLKSISVTLK